MNGTSIEFIPGGLWEQSECNRLLGVIAGDGDSFFNIADLRVLRQLWDVVSARDKLKGRIPWVYAHDPDRQCLQPQMGSRNDREVIIQLALLEDFGVVVCVPPRVFVDKYKQIQFLFKGSMCPFHRRTHRNNNWFLCESNNGRYYIGCFHGDKNKKPLNYVWPIGQLPPFKNYL